MAAARVSTLGLLVPATSQVSEYLGRLACHQALTNACATNATYVVADAFLVHGVQSRMLAGVTPTFPASAKLLSVEPVEGPGFNWDPSGNTLRLLLLPIKRRLCFGPF